MEQQTSNGQRTYWIEVQREQAENICKLEIAVKMLNRIVRNIVREWL